MEYKDFKELCSNKISDMSDCVAGISNSSADLQEAIDTGSSKEITEIAKSHVLYVNRSIARYDYLEKELWNLFQECSIPPSSLVTRNSSPRVQDSPKGKEIESAASSLQVLAAVTSQKSDNISSLEKYQAQMIGFYQIQNGDNRYIDFSGFYPRLRFIAGANPLHVREGYEFGMLGEIYLTPPEFNELSALPRWIKTGVIDNYSNNPTIKRDETLRLLCFSASPDFDKDNRYPAFIFMILTRCEKDQITISGAHKSYPGYEDNDVHEKRARDLTAIKNRMDNAMKKPFRTYSSGKQNSNLMITQLTRTTPPSAERFLSSYLKMIDSNEWPSSEKAQIKFCRRNHYKRQACCFCKDSTDSKTSMSE